MEDEGVRLAGHEGGDARARRDVEILHVPRREAARLHHGPGHDLGVGPGAARRPDLLPAQVLAPPDLLLHHHRDRVLGRVRRDGLEVAPARDRRDERRHPGGGELHFTPAPDEGAERARAALERKDLRLDAVPGEDARVLGDPGGNVDEVGRRRRHRDAQDAHLGLRARRAAEPRNHRRDRDPGEQVSYPVREHAPTPPWVDLTLAAPRAARAPPTARSSSAGSSGRPRGS